MAGCELKKSFPDESRVSGQSGDGGDCGIASSVASMGHGREGGGSIGNGSLGSQVVSTGGLHCWLVHGHHGAVGVAHQLGVQVQRAGVACK